MTIVLAVAVAILYAGGVYLLLQRTLSRIIVGLALLGHGANLLLLMAGGTPGAPPLLGRGSPPEAAADPLPQALALTAIVITFGVLAFLLALAYRSWIVTRDDTVEDDVEDRRIARQSHEETIGEEPGLEPGPERPGPGEGERPGPGEEERPGPGEGERPGPGEGRPE